LSKTDMAEEQKQNVALLTPELILLDAKRAAAMLGIGRAHLYALHGSGRLPLPIHLGRRTLWRADELKNWVQAGCPNRQRWIAMKGTKQ
jgi:predicted DNA-binding transcriptional regulator AlpA